MKFLIAFTLFIACAAADVGQLAGDAAAVITKSNSKSSPDGTFNYGYETSNGIVAEAAGSVQNANSDNPTLSIVGGYKYTSPDGTPIEISYIADELGYQPKGDSIPVAPGSPK